MPDPKQSGKQSVPPIEIGTWVLVSACPRCGMPIYSNEWDKSRPSGVPLTASTCTCFSEFKTGTIVVASSAKK